MRQNATRLPAASPAVLPSPFQIPFSSLLRTAVRLFLLFIIHHSSFLIPASAQLPTACGAGASPASACDEACIFCNFDGYLGSTIGYGQTEAIDFCGTLENGQWIGFIAGASQATFTVKPTVCFNGDGVQVALYTDCFSAPLACKKGQQFGANLPVSITVPLTPGSNYYLLVDGFAGDFCEFTIDVSPKEAVFEPPLGMVGALSGPIKGCAGAVFAYEAGAATGAGAYVWSGPPGTLINGDTTPVTVIGATGNVVNVTLGEQSGPLCVQAVNSCEQNPACASSLFVEILDDSHRPTVTGDTLAHLTCNGKPTVLTADAQPAGAYNYHWAATDSLAQLSGGAESKFAQTSQKGNYAVTVTDIITGCASTMPVRVDAPDYPDDPILTIKNLRCYGTDDGSVLVDSLLSGTAPFSFSLDGQKFTTTTFYQYLEPGPHTLVIRGEDGCFWDSIFTIREPKELLLNLGPDTTLHLGQDLSLWHAGMVNFPDRAAVLLSNPPEMLPLLCDTCRYGPLQSFRYTVTVLDSNGCRAADERTVTVNKRRHVFIPTAFAPDADEGNERFQVYGGEDVMEVVSVRVFSRWGKQVYAAEHLSPAPPPGSGWDGRDGGRALAPDVFLYVAEVLFKDGEREMFKGDVTLFR